MHSLCSSFLFRRHSISTVGYAACWPVLPEGGEIARITIGLTAEQHAVSCANMWDYAMSSAFENGAPTNPKAALFEEELAALRRLSLDERGRLIASACRTAAEILASRRRCGLPDEQPEPWPASTVEFLKRHARAWQKS